MQGISPPDVSPLSVKVHVHGVICYQNLYACILIVYLKKKKTVMRPVEELVYEKFPYNDQRKQQRLHYMEYHTMAWHTIVLHGMAWHTIVLHFLVHGFLQSTVLHGMVLHRTATHCIARCCMALQCNTIQFRLLARLRKLGPQLTQPQLGPLHNTLEFGKLEKYIASYCITA